MSTTDHRMDIISILVVNGYVIAGELAHKFGVKM
jgi:hypothetical protein